MRNGLFAFFLLLFVSLCAAASNRTIDDTEGDSVTGALPVYSPSSSWDNADCTGCLVVPSKSEAFDGTWTAATYNPNLTEMSIQFSFTGTAIYIYFIIANQVEYATTETACNFTLDGTLEGSYEHEPADTTDFYYHVLTFSKADLENAEHSMTISTSGITDRNIFVNFDYAVYISEDDSSSVSASASQTQTSSQQSTSTSVVVVTSTQDGTTTSSTTSSPSTSSPSSSSSNGGSSTQTSSSYGSSSTSVVSSSDSSSSSPGKAVATSVIYSTASGGRVVTSYTTSYSATSSSTSLDSGLSAASTSASDASSSHRAPVAAIAGGVAGGVVFLGLLLCLLAFCVHRRRRERDLPADVGYSTRMGVTTTDVSQGDAPTRRLTEKSRSSTITPFFPRQMDATLGSSFRPSLLPMPLPPHTAWPAESEGSPTYTSGSTHSPEYDDSAPSSMPVPVIVPAPPPPPEDSMSAGPRPLAPQRRPREDFPQTPYSATSGRSQIGQYMLQPQSASTRHASQSRSRHGNTHMSRWGDTDDPPPTYSHTLQ